MKKLWAAISIVLLIGLPIERSYANEQVVCGIGIVSCSVSLAQGPFLFNTQTTGAGAVAVTLIAVPGMRTVVHSIEARCNTAAATSGLTITDGGTTIWSTVATEVLAATDFVRNWTPGLTGTTNSQVVITLAACTAGTATLIVQASKQ